MTAPILVPLDGSHLADAAIPHAATMARRLHTGLLLVRVHHSTVMQVAPSEAALYVPDPAWEDDALVEAKAWLAERGKAFQALYRIPVETEFREGVPAEQIVEIATERRVEAIVCSTQGLGGWAPHWLGSVTDAIVRTAPCPVLAMSSAAAARPASVRRVLVPLDGTGLSASILPHVVRFARLFHAEVELFRVVPPAWVAAMMIPGPSADEDRFGIDSFSALVKAGLDDVAADLRRRGLRVTVTVEVDAHPSRTILRRIATTNPDAIAMATHGRGLSRLFLGSVADKILRAGETPTLLARPAVPAAWSADLADTVAAKAGRPVAAGMHS
jgi:nucleotide-binding universal stress UspA family protein